MIPNSRFFRLATLLLLLLVLLNLGYANKKKKKDPIEVLRNKWSTFDFKFNDKWQVEVSAFFILRSPEFMEEYFKILQDQQKLTEEEITKQKTILDEYLVVEVSMEALKKEDLAADIWTFELKDKSRNTYDPINVESLPVTKGDEFIASFKSFQPVTVQKKEGGSTVESITPLSLSLKKPIIGSPLLSCTSLRTIPKPTCPSTVNLEGELTSPFQRSPDSRSGSLPPLLGRGMNPRPAPAFAGASFDRQQIGSPDDRFPAASRGAYKSIVKKSKSWK